MSTRRADAIVPTRMPVALGCTVLTPVRAICSAPLGKRVTSVQGQLSVKTRLLQSIQVIRGDQASCFSEPRLPLLECPAGKGTLSFFYCKLSTFGMENTKRQQMCSLALLCIRPHLRVEHTLKLRRTRTDISVSDKSTGFSST